jgi:hypothetical protein
MTTGRINQVAILTGGRLPGRASKGGVAVIGRQASGTGARPAVRSARAAVPSIFPTGAPPTRSATEARGPAGPADRSVRVAGGGRPQPPTPEGGWRSGRAPDRSRGAVASGQSSTDVNVPRRRTDGHWSAPRPRGAEDDGHFQHGAQVTGGAAHGQRRG